MIESALNYLMASIGKSRLVEGLYTRDILEYPEEAVREAIVNAVAHREYAAQHQLRFHHPAQQALTVAFRFTQIR